MPRVWDLVGRCLLGVCWLRVYDRMLTGYGLLNLGLPTFTTILCITILFDSDFTCFQQEAWCYSSPSIRVSVVQLDRVVSGPRGDLPLGGDRVPSGAIRLCGACLTGGFFVWRVEMVLKRCVFVWIFGRFRVVFKSLQVGLSQWCFTICYAWYGALMDKVMCDLRKNARWSWP